MGVEFPRLLGDIGGTNVRWGWQPEAGRAIQDIETTPCGKTRSIYDAALSYLESHKVPAVKAASVGVAAPISGDEVNLTNNGWRFSISQLKQTLEIDRCLVINDFTALALSLPGLQKNELRDLRGESTHSFDAVESAPIAVLGPGTGLGVSGLFKSDSRRWVAIAGEGGHTTLPAATDRESAVIEHMRARQAHISAEDVLSGAGVIRLYRAICELDGHETRGLEPQEITQAAISHTDEACVETIRQFSGFLGSVAGNLALTLGARGGVYIGGGIVPKLGNAFDETLFRRRFEEKGRFMAYLRHIPSWLITADNPALVGASHALDWA